MNKLFRIKTIAEYHHLVGMHPPIHPLISIFELSSIKRLPLNSTFNMVYDFYSISIKQNTSVSYKYGQQNYDGGNGQLYFMAPGQLFSIVIDQQLPVKPKGWVIFLHPDLLWGTSLATSINRYGFFEYAVNEALSLSAPEQKKIIQQVREIRQECLANTDSFSQQIIITQIELLLNYAERYYHRQFLTSKINDHRLLSQLEIILNNYFESDVLKETGLPSVQGISAQLNISPSYLRSFLKATTGLNTQQHIHEKLIEKAKSQLSTTMLTVSEIAYALGFDHPQSFSKLFKARTRLSPLQFRASFHGSRP